MKFTRDTNFDAQQIQDEEIRDAIKPLIETYNTMVSDLSQVLRQLSFQDNFAGRVQSFNFVSGQTFIIGKQNEKAIVLECTQSIDKSLISSTTSGLTVKIDTEGSLAGTVKILVIP